MSGILEATATAKISMVTNSKSLQVLPMSEAVKIEMPSCRGGDLTKIVALKTSRVSFAKRPEQSKPLTCIISGLHKMSSAL